MLAGAGLLLASSPAPAQAQAPAQAGRAPAPAGAQAFVDDFTAARLVWSTMAALDHANRTGNYSVMRDLGSPNFQASNSPATLGGIFQDVRSQQIDLSYALNVSPAWEFAPTVLANGLLRTRGTFPLRPTAIGFDMLFENVGGQWRLFGISVARVNPPAAPAPTPAPRRR
ncbi:MAG TPA: hypothetical protein VF552_01855 [Allosphingosinicella sp.]|jgi:hypothetical protein